MPYHAGSAFRAVHLIAGNPSLMGCRSPTIGADTLSGGSGSRSRAAHPAPAAASFPYTFSGSRTAPAGRTGSISSWHLSRLLPLFYYSRDMAPSGHSSRQLSHSTHSSRSILALSFSMVIASLGHASTQLPHPVHFSSSTIIAMTITFLALIFLLFQDFFYLRYPGFIS